METMPNMVSTDGDMLISQNAFYIDFEDKNIDTSKIQVKAKINKNNLQKGPLKAWYFDEGTQRWRS